MHLGFKTTLAINVYEENIMKSITSTSTWQDDTNRSFEVPVKHEAGCCSEPECSCGNAVIPKGTGYLHIIQKVVDFRKDCPTPRDLLRKLNKTQADLGCFETFELDHGAVYPRLLCRQAATRHQLSLEVAAQDAENWWNTGEVPLRSTPTSHSS
jgi:hypothetical protein